MLEKQITEQEQQQIQLAASINDLIQQQAQKKGEATALTQALKQWRQQQGQPADCSLAQKEWLNIQGVNTRGIVHQSLHVESDWQACVEQVLQHWLQGELVENFPEQLTIEPLFLVRTKEKSATSPNTLAKQGSLAEKVTGLPEVSVLLNHIMLAENYQQALALLPSLAEHQSVICQDGTWLSHCFLRKGSVDNHNALLHLAENIADTERQLNEFQVNLHDIQERLAQFVSENNQLNIQSYALKTQQQQGLKQNQLLQQQIALAKQAEQQRNKQNTIYQQELAELEH